MGLAITAAFFRIASLADSAAVGYDTPGLQEASSTRQSVPYFDFFWTEEIVDHLSEHDVMTLNVLSRTLRASGSAALQEGPAAGGKPLTAGRCSASTNSLTRRRLFRLQPTT